MTPTEIKAAAYDSIVEYTEQLIDRYMAKRLHDHGFNEMLDWTRDEIRDFFLDLVEEIETIEYTVSETISGQERNA